MEEDERQGKPDPLSQLVTTFCRGAMTERSGALQEDPLYMSYAQIVAKSCGEEEEDDSGGEPEEGPSIHVIILGVCIKHRAIFFSQKLRLNFEKYGYIFIIPSIVHR